MDNNQQNAAPSSGNIGRAMNVFLFKLLTIVSGNNVLVNGVMEAKSHEQQEVEKSLHRRVGAQEKYMKSIVEKAQQALASGCYKPSASD
uniref:MYB-CC type transcription factor LHEQLE-containing domain-containing protein n=1 Tax=Oryza brachyantha TaxID=4533 RepID=J3MGM1_ORYBR